MKLLYRIFVIIIVMQIAALSQVNSGSKVKINSLDFSRFPKVDLFVTTVNEQGEALKFDSTNIAPLYVKHNGTNIKLQSVSSVFELKEKGETELYISLVFDNSASMEHRNELLENAAKLFIQGIKPGDYVNVIDFGRDEGYIQIPEYKEPIHARQRIDFGNSRQLLTKSVTTPNFTQRTYMYDALMFALSSIHQIDVLGKKVIIFFSDGQNIGSVTSSDDVLKLATEYEVPIYAIDLGRTENKVLQKLAAETAGEYFFVTEPEALGAVYQSVLKLLKNQYRFTYPSPVEFVSSEKHAVEFSLDDTRKVQDRRLFTIEGEKIGYYNLVYYENLGQENVNRYLDYVFAYPASKYKDFVELKLGNLWLNRGEFAKANSTYNKIIRNPSGPAYLDALYQKGILLERAKQFAQARKAFNQILSSQTNSPLRAKSLLDIAKTYSAEGNFVSAIETYSSLTSKYAGTEYASEALLQSANLSIQMGDLKTASTNLSNVVSTYTESKSAVYAKLELANLEARNTNFTKAEELYKDVLASKADPELIDQTKIKLIDLYTADKNYTGARDILNELAKAGTPLLSSEEISYKLVTANFMAGDAAAGRNQFEGLPVHLQKAYLENTEPMLVPPNAPDRISLVNGVTVKGLTDPKSIAIIELAEYREKFPVIGPIYSIKPSEAEKEITIPVYTQWLTEHEFNPLEGGIYTIKNNILELIPAQFSTGERAFSFKSRGGIFMLLKSKPKVITLYNIYFDLGKATIRKDAEKNLYETIDYLKSFPSLKMEIAGHTDSTGSDELNTKLSLARAKSIKDFIVINGIAEERLVERGYGSQYPVAPNNNDENRQKNRRTEFIIVSGSGLVLDEKTSIKQRFMVILNSYSSIKEAYDTRKFLLQRGNSGVSVLFNQKPGLDQYNLILGIYESKEDAENAVKNFTQEYKQFTPTMVSM